MIPFLYEQDEQQFANNGLGALTEAKSCEVEEERNGTYTLKMVYPEIGRRFKDLTVGRIIMAKAGDVTGKQPFRIYRITKPIKGLATIYANHISYDMATVTVNPFTAVSCADALMKLKTNSTADHPFTFWTDKEVSSSYALKAPNVLRSLLGGIQGSILDVFGTGEYEFDRFAVKLYLHRGNDNGVRIAYGKNLVDATMEANISKVFTAVHPYWKDSEGEEIVTLPESIVKSEYYDSYPIPKIELVDLSDEFDEAPTVDQLRQRAQKYIEDNYTGVPEISFKVDFIALWQTEQYKDIAPLERISLCDTITVDIPKIGVSNVKAKVIKTQYDAIKERYLSLEIGDYKTTLADKILESSNDINQLKNSLENRFRTNTNELEQAIVRVTQAITGNSGGYVVLHPAENPQEILIMDQPTINDAVKIWRWNKEGLGYSKNGYNGPYGLAITADGEIVADYITTGILTANLIKAGVLSDKAGLNFWNLETGEFSLRAVQQIDEKISDLESSAITSVVVEYAINQSSTIVPTSGWSTDPPAWEDGSFIWQRTSVTVDDNTTTTAPVCITGAKGATGAQGPAGADGTSVSILGSYDSLEDLQAAHPTGNTGDGYMVGQDLYVWNETAWEDVGQIKGDKGDDGEQGVSVTSLKAQYYLSTSASAPTGGSWSDSQQTYQSGKHYFTRTLVTYSNNTTSYAPSANGTLAQGLNNANANALNAVGTANTANANASDAKTAAGTALATANTANSKATSALSTATAANTNAGLAQSAIEALDASLYSKEVFDRLMKKPDGTIAQGMVMDANGNLYVAAEYIQAGTVEGLTIKGLVAEFGESPNIVTIGTNSNNNGVLFDGTGNIDMNTRGQLSLRNKVLVDGVEKTENNIGMFRSDTKSSTEMYNRWNGVQANSVDLEADELRNILHINNRLYGGQTDENGDHILVNYLHLSSMESSNNLYLFNNYKDGTDAGGLRMNAYDDRAELYLSGYDKDGKIANRLSSYVRDDATDLWLTNYFQDHSGHQANNVHLRSEEDVNYIGMYNRFNDDNASVANYVSCSRKDSESRFDAFNYDQDKLQRNYLVMKVVNDASSNELVTYGKGTNADGTKHTWVSGRLLLDGTGTSTLYSTNNVNIRSLNGEIRLYGSALYFNDIKRW